MNRVKSSMHATAAFFLPTRFLEVAHLRIAFCATNGTKLTARINRTERPAHFAKVIAEEGKAVVTHQRRGK